MTDRRRFSKSERQQLRAIAREAWEAELHAALAKLFEDFGVWADKRIDSFELSDRIHAFHDGISRELFGRYASLNPVVAVSRAVARGYISEDRLDETLREKLAENIESFREVKDD